MLSTEALANLRLDTVASQFCEHRGLRVLDEAERMAETDVPSYRLEVSIVGSASSVGDDRNDFHPLGRTAGAPLGLHWGRRVWISR